MRTQVKLDVLKNEMRHRLTGDPRSLDLNPRVDEAPEDIYIRLAESSQRNAIVAMACELITESVTRVNRTNLTATTRLLSSAIRLSSAIGAKEFVPVLKLVLLEQGTTVWGSRLDKLQELAARALLGLATNKSDLPFWKDIAYRQETSLPYALRALVEIDLREGLRVFWQLYLQSSPENEREDPLVDWSSILEDADEHYDLDRISAYLERTFYETQGFDDPHSYEKHLRRYLRLPKYSRSSDRSFSELPMGYDSSSPPNVIHRIMPSTSHKPAHSYSAFLNRPEQKPNTAEPTGYLPKSPDQNDPEGFKLDSFRLAN